MSNPRKVTNEDIKKYEPMIEKFMRDNVQKNWNEASLKPERDDIFLGNTGWTMKDIRQQLRMEVCIALQKFNPNYRTAEGKTVKESTWVYTCLWSRVGQAMKRLTKARYGYGVWANNIEAVLYEIDRE